MPRFIGEGIYALVIRIREEVFQNKKLPSTAYSRNLVGFVRSQLRGPSTLRSGLSTGRVESLLHLVSEESLEFKVVEILQGCDPEDDGC